MKRPIDGFRTTTLFFVLALPFAAQGGNCAERVIRTADPPMRATQTIQTISTDAGKKPCFDEGDGETGGAREEAVIANLPEHYQYWLTEDVVYIITPEERCAYLQLNSAEEWDQFIDQFWIRRASDPESLLNEYQEEHYRRIVFANENFAAATVGWMIDRGHIYIEFGPPDNIELHPSGEPAAKLFGEDAATARFPYEVWRYRYIEGLGGNVVLEFIDATGAGDYRLTAWSEVKIEFAHEAGPMSEGSIEGSIESEALSRLELYIGVSPSSGNAAQRLGSNGCFTHPSGAPLCSP